MADVTHLQVADIGKVNLLTFEIHSDKKTLVVTKFIDGTSHLLAKWHQRTINGENAALAASLTVADPKTSRDKLHFEFTGVTPILLSLEAGNSRGRAREKLEFAYESYKDRSPISLEFAARGFVPQG